MSFFRKYTVAAGLLIVPAIAAPVPFAMTRAAQASEVKVIVNNIPITDYDIARRAAFLRIQHKSPAGAKQDMIDQTLHEIEMRRLQINIPDKEVDAAFTNFAKKNKMTAAQLTQALAHAGVGAAHFKAFIRASIGWGRALGARSRAEGGGSSVQEAVDAMLKKGGEKPSATEYTLQQVIFVVPNSERNAILGKRKREAEALRARFSGCDKTRDITKGLIDVTVRDLPRVLAPELPPDWADPIKKTKAGQATEVRTTPRGVEFIGICAERQVSDDRVAQLTFQGGEQQDKKTEELSKKYTQDLRNKAVIIER
ncbi:MAG: molecular chaperone SurA [Rhizobiales bacterium 65-79]|nr:peptidylprolyl isomerase [Hyphomicrobiales bacterium]OJU05426.1 MAG: molecular chaperone SurA [Rhizobiales bacterium 65-79]